MSRIEAWTVHASVLLVGGTGLVYAWMLYLLEPLDEFSVVHHRWQPLTQHAHVLVAPLLVFALGLIWRNHAYRHYQTGEKKRRRSGLTLLLGVAPMIVSGYLLQTSVSASWRAVWLTLHLTTAALFLAGYLAHQLGSRRKAARSAATVGNGPGQPQEAP